MMAAGVQNKGLVCCHIFFCICYENFNSKVINQD